MRAAKLTLWAATLVVVAWTLSLVSAVIGSKGIGIPKPPLPPLQLKQPIRATED